MPIPDPEPCTECPYVITTNRCPTCDAAVCGICNLHHKHSHTAPKRPTVRTCHGETGEADCTNDGALYRARYSHERCRVCGMPRAKAEEVAHRDRVGLRCWDGKDGGMCEGWGMPAGSPRWSPYMLRWPLRDLCPAPTPEAPSILKSS